MVLLYLLFNSYHFLGFFPSNMIRVFRIILGVYLTFHLLELVPWAEELFGNKMPYDPITNPLYGIFPNLLNLVNATAFLSILTLLAMCLTIEFYPRICAPLLWYGWAAMFNRNPLISNPGLPYVGWLLLGLIFVEERNDAQLSYYKHPWTKWLFRYKIHNRVYWSAWILLALGYTASGLHKLKVSPSWIDGTALEHVLNSPLARDNFLRDYLVQCPTFLKYSTWFSLFLEISFLPLGTFYYTRPIYWLMYMGFHLGILCLINFSDLTWGVMMVHFFTFDSTWVGWVLSWKKERQVMRMIKFE